MYQEPLQLRIKLESYNINVNCVKNFRCASGAPGAKKRFFNDNGRFGRAGGIMRFFSLVLAGPRERIDPAATVLRYVGVRDSIDRAGNSNSEFRSHHLSLCTLPVCQSHRLRHDVRIQPPSAGPPSAIDGAAAPVVIFPIVPVQPHRGTLVI